MPIYEYHCGKCGDFEVMQKMSDKPLSVCPTCRRKVAKLISSTSFHLKGSGWYVTDYARKGSAGVAASEKSTKSEDKKSDTSGTSDGSSKASGETAGSGESSKSGGGESSSKSSGESKKSSGGKASSEKAAAA